MNITVYCGASMGVSPLYKEAAVEIGQWIADCGHTLVYGGGNTGLMGLLSEAVYVNGGKVIGIIPEFLVERELLNTDIGEVTIVETMSERKKKMFNLGQAFIALPGGLGTLEEISEVVSWARLGQNQHPCVFYNKNHFYDKLEAFIDHMVEEGFLDIEGWEKILFSDKISAIEKFFEAYTPPIF